MTASGPDSTPRSSKGLKIAGLVVLVLGLGLDLWTKAHFESLLGMDPSPRTGASAAAAQRIEVVEGFLAWEGTYNPGVTFGLAANNTTAILALTGLATIGLVVWLLGTAALSRALHVGLGMIIGGALGNLYDRFHWSKVRDFVLVYTGEPGAESFKWPNFNVADTLIVVGVILVMWDSLFGLSAKEAKAAEALRKAAKAREETPPAHPEVRT